MLEKWSDKIDTILKNGISLESIGVNNWALSKNDAIHALFELSAIQVSILGGDVCEFIDGEIKYNYDNWYCDREVEESRTEYLKRSISTAIRYIENYDAEKIDDVYFVIVPDMKGQ